MQGAQLNKQRWINGEKKSQTSCVSLRSVRKKTSNLRETTERTDSQRDDKKSQTVIFSSSLLQCSHLLREVCP